MTSHRCLRRPFPSTGDVDDDSESTNLSVSLPVPVVGFPAVGPLMVSTVAILVSSRGSMRIRVDRLELDSNLSRPGSRAAIVLEWSALVLPVNMLVVFAAPDESANGPSVDIVLDW